MEEDLLKEAVFTNTVSVLVSVDQNNQNTPGVNVQLWPCIHVPHRSQIAQTVKEIYSKLAAMANELDEGIPELLVSLVSTGNHFDSETFLLAIIAYKEYDRS
ncbi:unnamed protein product [Bursaphelenchus okinawaensis]|uniref:Uncharacterized protein n=1 Tax=Bursaphelenchus okinawaensis TaxID=465554 RepID=A0A811KLD2_9BILA|nr:unnamed protein product [Bursaphelenchus okinawaensis]CAG9105866.1 unnamed protein product [Bursaphelenchus okinawaensis]